MDVKRVNSLLGVLQHICVLRRERDKLEGQVVEPLKNIIYSKQRWELEYSQQHFEVTIPNKGAEPLSDYRQTSELTIDDFRLFVYCGEARNISYKDILNVPLCFFN